MVEFDKEAETLAGGFGIPIERLDNLMDGLNGKNVMDAIHETLVLPDVTTAERVVMLISIGFGFGQAKLRQQAQLEERVFENLNVH